MGKFLKLILVWIALAGLPVQGFASVTMSYCKHGAADAAVVADESHARHCASHSGDSPPAPAAQPCNDCTACHLCSALGLPSVSTVAAPLAASLQIPRLSPQPDGFLPDQPKPPPLA